MSGTVEQRLYVVQVDTRGEITTNIDRYKETTTPPDFFDTLLARQPHTVAHKCQVAECCGLNVTIYFTKYKQGLAGIVSNNNGAATYLTLDPTTGHSKYIVVGRAYVVQDDGWTPLSKKRVWGLVEMVNCLMNVYDADPDNIRRGRDLLERWAEGYKRETWEPPSGTFFNIYADRSLDTSTRTSSDRSRSAQQSSAASDGQRNPTAVKQQQAMSMMFKLCTQKFFRALEYDMYPDEETEKVFGIEMGGGPAVRSERDMPKGNLIYGVWKEIFSNERENALANVDLEDTNAALQLLDAALNRFGDDIVDALMNEQLGEKFREWTMNVAGSNLLRMRAYSTEMIRRGFDGPMYVNADSPEHRQWIDRVHQLNQDAAAERSSGG